MQRTLSHGIFLLCSLVAIGCAGTQPRLKPEVARSLSSLAPEPALFGESTTQVLKQRDGSEVAQATVRTGMLEHVGRRLRDAGSGLAQIGRASFYHDFFNGRTTANGEKFSNQMLTAAHRTLEFGTKVRVTNLENAKSVVVTINDRGPYVAGRIIDLSRRAASQLGFVNSGLARVRVEPLLASQETP